MYKQNIALKAKVAQLESSEQNLSNELERMNDKYQSLFDKSILTNEAELQGIMDQLKELLTGTKSSLEKLPLLKKYKVATYVAV